MSVNNYKCELIYKCEQRESEQYLITKNIN